MFYILHSLGEPHQSSDEAPHTHTKTATSVLALEHHAAILVSATTVRLDGSYHGAIESMRSFNAKGSSLL